MEFCFSGQPTEDFLVTFWFAYWWFCLYVMLTKRNTLFGCWEKSDMQEWSLNLAYCILFYSSSILLYFPFYYVVKIARWRQDIHHLRDDFEKAFLEEEKALTKFDVHWKDIRKDVSKVLEQSEDQNKKKHLEKQLQKMVFLMFSTLNQLTWVFVWIKQIFTTFRDFFVGAFLSQFKYELDFISLHCHWYPNLLMNFLLYCSCSTYLIFIEYQWFMGHRCPTWFWLRFYNVVFWRFK